MSLTLADRVKEESTTTGNGTLDLDGAVTGFQTFVDGAGDGATVPYAIIGQEGEACEGEWETGEGTVTDAATDTLSRDTVHDSSAGGAKVVFSAGTKDVILPYTADMASKNVQPVEEYEPSADSTLDIDLPDAEMVRLVGHITPATDNVSGYIRFSNDGGSTFRSGASDYGYVQNHEPVSGGAGTEKSSGAAQIHVSNWLGNGASEGIKFDLSIIQPAEAAEKTMIMGWIGCFMFDGSFHKVSLHGWVTTAEVNDAIQFYFSSGNVADGRVVVYKYPAP